MRTDLLVWEGHRYTWSSRGYWRSTSYHDRHLLTRRIWERHHGTTIPHGHQIVFADGDKWNVAPENLLCLSRREAQLRRLADPEKRAISAAYLAYGLLVGSMLEATDPERKRERFRKVVAARRARGNYATGSEKAWRTRKDRYGPKGHSGGKDPDRE